MREREKSGLLQSGGSGGHRLSPETASEHSITYQRTTYQQYLPCWSGSWWHCQDRCSHTASAPGDKPQPYSASQTARTPPPAHRNKATQSRDTEQPSKVHSSKHCEPFAVLQVKPQTEHWLAPRFSHQLVLGGFVWFLKQEIPVLSFHSAKFQRSIITVELTVSANYSWKIFDHTKHSRKKLPFASSLWLSFI